MRNDRLRKLLEDTPVTVEYNPAESDPVEELPKDAPEDKSTHPLSEPIVKVMSSYQNANRWMDIIKEDLLINKGTVFFSNYVHDLAHTMPVRFDAFGDILHTGNILVPYPPTGDIPYSLNDINEVFIALFNILESISISLCEFIKATESTRYHSMACKSEELLIDIDTENEDLYRMKKICDNCQDVVKFDKWVNQYLNSKVV